MRQKSIYEHRPPTDEEAYEDYLDEIEESEEEEEEAPAEQEVEEVPEEDDPLRAADLAAMNETDDDAEVTDESPSTESSEGEADSEEQTEAELGDEMVPEETQATGAQTTPEDDRRVITYAEGTIDEVDNQLTELVDKQESLIARREELEDKWEEGDVSIEDKRKALKEIRAEERQLVTEERTLNNQRDQLSRQERETQHYWEMDTKRFFHENPDYANSKILTSALNQSIQDVAAEEGWLGRGNTSILNEARNRVDAELGRGEAPAPKEEAKKEPTGKEATEGKKAALKGREAKPKIPKTLSNVPAADDPPIQKDTFASLDDLEGPEFESAYAALSAADKRKYLETPIH